jgi:hypothetical protein
VWISVKQRKRESLKNDTYNGTLHVSHDFNDGAIANGSVDDLVGVVDGGADLLSSGEWHVFSAVEVIDKNVIPGRQLGVCGRR